MSDLQNIIKFYRDCYQFEYNTEKVSNFYASSVTELFYPNTFKLLSRKGYDLPVASNWGRRVATELELASSEKKLVCGSFFMKGKMDILGRNHRIFTPLLLHDIVLSHEDEVYSLRLDQESINLNPIAIQYLNSSTESPPQNYDDLSIEIMNIRQLFSFSGLLALQDLIKEKYPTLNTDLFEKRIEMEERISDLEQIYHSRKKTVENKLFPDVLIGMIEKPKKSKNVINELTDLSERSHVQDKILSTLFKKKQASHFNHNSPQQERNEIVVPISLSQGQEQILKSSSQSPSTLVIGPPGTGKSFSIAALAIQAFHEGKKILIASKNEQACQVIYNKIHHDIGVKGITINASKARYKMSVSTKLRNIANGIGVGAVDLDRLKKMRVEIRMLKNTIEQIANEIAQREAIEEKWGRQLANQNSGLFSNLQKRWIKYQHSLKKPIWRLKFDLHALDKKLKLKERRLIKLDYQNNLYQLLLLSRPELMRYEKAFQEERGNVIKEIFSSVDFNIVLKALPIWICRSVDVANIVPLEAGLFDLLIIDEASQCDISSSIPLIYRANSMTIVGDPNQLRHVSFISKNKEASTKVKYQLANEDLAYRNRSILDQVNQTIVHQENIIFLDEHFRSKPDIIHFSNQEFYSGQLKIMTDHLHEKNDDNLKIVVVEKGERNQKGENNREAQGIVARIKAIIRQEKPIKKRDCSTIGIISPFRNQMLLIKRLVREKIEPEQISKHKILIGTPFSFQGEERDIVFLSFTIDEQTHHGTIRYLERPDVFNVSITRAKNYQEVYLSIDPKKLKDTTLLSRYLRSKFERHFESDEKQGYDDFLEEVKESLEALNVGKIFVDRTIGGAQLDLLIVQENATLGIDLIGFPGEYTSQLTFNEIMSLERAKIEVFLLPYSTWYLNNKLCIQSLKNFLEI